MGKRTKHLIKEDSQVAKKHMKSSWNRKEREVSDIRNYKVLG